MKIAIGFICIAIIMFSAILFMKGVEQEDDNDKE